MVSVPRRDAQWGGKRHAATVTDTGTPADGSPLTVESLCASPLFLSKASAGSRVADGLAAFPTVSMGENPSNGHNSAYLHPCETAKWIATLLEQDSKSGALAALESFVMLCSTVVEMRPGSKGAALHDGPKVLSLRKAKEGEDMRIATVKFADLMKKLPNVKVSRRAGLCSRSLAHSCLLYTVGGGGGKGQPRSDDKRPRGCASGAPSAPGRSAQANQVALNHASRHPLACPSGFE